MAAKKAIDIADAYAPLLPNFPSLVEARRGLFADRDQALEHLASLDVAAAGFSLDFTPESLRGLERWYYALYRSRGFKRAGTERKRLEAAMAYYVGAIAKRRVTGTKWTVEEYRFGSGHPYEIGISNATGLSKVMLGGMCGDWYKTRPNVKEDQLYRHYRDWWIPRAPPAKPKLASDDAALAREIERMLGLKSSPLIYPGQLVTWVRHNLHEDGIAASRIESVAKSMLAKGILEKVPNARKAGFRYGLAKRT